MEGRFTGPIVGHPKMRLHTRLNPSGLRIESDTPATRADLRSREESELR